MKSLYFLLVAFFAMPLLAQAQADIPVQYFNFKAYGRAQGLRVGSVTTITEGKDGLMWLGTEKGLLRFDGSDFKEIKMPDGTTIGHITYLFTSRDGTIWIGSRLYRLLKYEPNDNRLTIILPTNKDPFYIQAIAEDKNGNLWFSGQKNEGIIHYETKSDKISKFHPDTTDQTFTFFHVLEDKANDNFLWLPVLNKKTGFHGLCRFDKSTQKFQFFLSENKANTSLTISNIIQDTNGELWFSDFTVFPFTLYHFNPKTTTYQTYIPPLPDIKCWSILPHSQEEIWLLCRNEILLFNIKTKQFKVVLPNVTQKFTMEVFADFYKDKQGNLWIGKEKDAPLYLINKDLQAFQFFPIEEKNTISKNVPLCTTFFEDTDSNKNYIGGVNTNGIIVVNHKGELLYKIPFEFSFEYSKSASYIIQKIYKDKFDKIWLSSNYGILYVDIVTNKLKLYEKYQEIKKIVSDEVFYVLAEDSKGFLWAGTRYEGLFRLSPDRQSFTHYPSTYRESKSLLKGAYIRFLYELDRKIWAGTRQGISIFNLEKESFEDISQTALHYFDGTSVRDVLPAGKDKYWIGVRPSPTNKTSGFFLYDKNLSKEKQIQKINIQDDLKDLGVGHIAKDKNGDVWITFDYKLTKYEVKTGKFTPYDISDFMTETVFNDCPIQSMSDGTMILGEAGGFYRWHPDSLKRDTTPPTISFSSFKINNQDTTFAKSLDYIDEIVLPYDLNFISLTFAALSYTKPERNQYAYQLVGYDKDWVQAGNNRVATYTDLPHGEYTFRVKASNHDGVWNEKGKSLKIKILPPFWLTWWAYTFYAMVVLASVWSLRRAVIQRERLKASAELNALKSARLEEVDKLKSQFFSNISHEFRTPLTLILSPVEKRLTEKNSLTEGEGWVGATSGAIKSEFRLIYRNAKRLLELINQLLDVTKLEAGTMEVSTSAKRLDAFLEKIAENFRPLSQEKGIYFSVAVASTNVYAQIDSDKVSKILNNLLSNAFKFTPEGGIVAFSASIEKIENQISPLHRGRDEEVGQKKLPKSYLHLKVSDTGIGIPQAHLDKVFDRFHQVESSLSRKYEGSGIGLSLTKELVNLLGGEILVESEEEKGSIFFVKLPLVIAKAAELSVGTQTTAIESSEVLSEQTQTKDAVLEILSAQTTAMPFLKTQTTAQNEGVGQKKQPLCLIVEDNTDMRIYLESCLNVKFQVLTAENGKIGYEIAVKQLPDLIVTDVMMPLVNGFELCKFLKENELTNHIPIVMLTAKANPESRVEGVEYGADSYLVKPFYARELVAVSINLVKHRRILREKFGKELKKENKISHLNPESENFMQKVKNVVEEYLPDTDFNNEKFAEALNLSTSQLSRKLKATINQTPSDFVRTYRLHRAAELLANKTANVSEIAFQVGFDSLSYFTKCFKEQFGKVPSEF